MNVDAIHGKKYSALCFQGALLLSFIPIFSSQPTEQRSRSLIYVCHLLLHIWIPKGIG